MKYHTKAISVFHQINAFEDNGFLMLDMCCADDGQAINNYLIQNLRKSGEALDQVSICINFFYASIIAVSHIKRHLVFDQS